MNSAPLPARRSIFDRAASYARYRRAQWRVSDVNPWRRYARLKLVNRATAYFEATESRRWLAKQFGRSTSTGAEVTDYYLLHHYIKSTRPLSVLEFGSGVTSMIMAHAFFELAEERGHLGRLVTIEDIPQYHANLVDIMPAELAPFATPLRTDKCEDVWRGEIWGVRYTDLPPGPFDMVYVDGPTEYVNGRKGACLDLLFLLDRDRSVTLDVIVDRKMSSLEAFQSVLPPRRVGYDPVADVGVISCLSGREIENAASPKGEIAVTDAGRQLNLAL